MVREIIKHFPDSDLGVWIRWLATVALVPIVVTLFATDGRHDNEISTNRTNIEIIQSNRFTSRDAAALQIEIAKQNAEMLAVINDIRRGDAVAEERIYNLQEDLRELQTRVYKIHE